MLVFSFSAPLETATEASTPELLSRGRGPSSGSHGIPGWRLHEWLSGIWATSAQYAGLPRQRRRRPPLPPPHQVTQSAGIQTDEVDLVRSAALGDRAAQHALFDRHQRGVMGYCLLACSGDRERARELTQETFLRALTSLRQLQESKRFRSWLYSIAANLCRGLGMQEARRRELLAVAQLSLDVAPLEDEPREREARIALVQRLLSRVEDPSVRAVVSLKYGEPEHTTREIAARLGLPHGTVTSKLVRFRAAINRELLRAMLEEAD